MKRALFAMTLAAATLGAHAADVARFDGGIGSQPLAGTPANVIANDVLGVPPGGRPWEIARLKASVHHDGTIRVQGRGLILGGGGNVGRPAIPRQVAATLFCGGIPSTSEPVDLDAEGDFVIRSALTPAPVIPCADPVLLIRNFANGAPGSWFAAGIPEKD